MATGKYIFTSESVSEGHPDKVADQISDAIVDTYFKADPYSRLGVETLVSTNRVILAGEVRGPDSVTNQDLEDAVRQTIKKIGYEQDSFHWEKVEILNCINQQSPDIAQGVDGDGDREEGAGDQGIMFGYACNQTDTLMPAAIFYSHRILKALSAARHSGKEPLLGPDAKSQVTLEYDGFKAIKARSIVVSTQHDATLNQEDVRNIVRPYIKDVLPEGWMCPEDELYVNPTGTFVIGGPHADAGLTGRKIIVDTYGGSAPHGGGAFSGKDPTKVDRSATYAARYLAKNVGAAQLADACTVQLSYAIGVAKPISVYVFTHDTSTIDQADLSEALTSLMDLSPRGIREHLDLHRPIYQPTATYGHFGRAPSDDGHFSWERTDLVDKLRAIFDKGDYIKKAA